MGLYANRALIELVCKAGESFTPISCAIAGVHSPGAKDWRKEKKDRKRGASKGKDKEGIKNGFYSL